VNIPRYWFRAKGQVPAGIGKIYDLVAWGWSSAGRDGAERKAAQERLAAFAQRVQQGLLPHGGRLPGPGHGPDLHGWSTSPVVVLPITSAGR
jgi:hypothetical protein